MAGVSEKKFNYKTVIMRMLLVVIFLSLSGWFLTTHYVNAQTIIYVIPAGTSQRLAAGEETVEFPNELTFTVGDKIVIENQDDAVHAFGPFTILPNTTLTKRFETARTYQSTCTFHQNKKMTLVVNPAPWNIFAN